MFIFFFVNFWDCAYVYMKYLWWGIFLHIIQNERTMFFRVKFVSFLWLPVGHNTVCSSQAYRYSDFTDLEKAHLSPLHLGTTEAFSMLNVVCSFPSLPRFLSEGNERIPCNHYSFTPLPENSNLGLWGQESMLLDHGLSNKG